MFFLDGLVIALLHLECLYDIQMREQSIVLDGGAGPVKPIAESSLCVFSAAFFGPPCLFRDLRPLLVSFPPFSATPFVCWSHSKLPMNPEY